MAEPHPIVWELRTRRLLRGMTLKEIEELTGIPDSTVNQWETGRYDPPLPRLEKYADVMGLRLGLIWKENDGTPGTAAQAEDHQLRLLREDG